MNEVKIKKYILAKLLNVRLVSGQSCRKTCKCDRKILCLVKKIIPVLMDNCAIFCNHKHLAVQRHLLLLSLYCMCINFNYS